MMNKDTLIKLFKYNKDGTFTRLVTVSSKAKEGQKVKGYFSQGYLNTRVNNKSYRYHRLVYTYFFDTPKKHVDHIDGNTLNNRIKNLRQVCPSQNVGNTKLSKRNKSGARGVSFYSKKWTCRLYFKNKSVFYFRSFSKKECCKKCTEKYLEVWGEYARY